MFSKNENMTFATISIKIERTRKGISGLPMAVMTTSLYEAYIFFNFKMSKL